MRIIDLLQKQGISLKSNITDSEGAAELLIGLQEKSGNLKDKIGYKKAIEAREAQGTTAIGEGIAVPHAKSSSVKRAGLSAATFTNGVDYNAPDSQPVKLMFMIAATEDADEHLEILSRLMVMLMDQDFSKSLINASSADEFLSLIDKQETEKYGAKAELQDKSGYKVLAVTSCPTGIAHTYMAAEALCKAGERLGYPLKAETQGSGGAKNILTAEEIAAADGIIIAADKNVDMSRFDGKKVIVTKVSDGINKPEELINRIKSGDAHVYRHSGDSSARTDDTGESAGRKFYKHLMNGVSHMLPFVVGGGILIAIAFLIDTIAGAPQDSNFGTFTPLAAFFKTIGGYAFNIMVPILSGYIAMSIADRPGLLVGLVGGFLATSGSTFTMPGGDVPSGFLGALVAGFVGGYMMLLIRRLCDKLPQALEGIKPVLIYPILGLLGISVIMCALNPLMGFINTGMNNILASMNEGSKIVLGCVLAGMMAVDMGGPFNKAAYVFGTAAISSVELATNGGGMIMAAVMIGGMVPPLAIALCATFFKNKFTKQERKSAPVNYIMGLSFITEGAIPFAASDPLRVIPSCVVGSAVAGGLSMLFGCSLRAPHGGIFVFPVVENVLGYISALAIGAAVGMLLLAVLKKSKYSDEKENA